MQIMLAHNAISDYLHITNSEQAGRPRSSRPRRMKTGMIRQNQNAGEFMCKPEPKIVANGLSNEELYQWMRAKISAAGQLKEALADRESTLQALKRLDEKIALLSHQSAIEFSDKESGPIPSR